WLAGKSHLRARVSGDAARARRFAGLADGVGWPALRLLGIPGTELLRFPGVSSSRTMAGFAPHPQLARLNRAIYGDTKWAGGVAGKTSQDGCGRIENAIPHSGRAQMARRPGIPIERTIPALALFQIVFRIQPLHECDRLNARPECPVVRVLGACVG